MAVWFTASLDAVLAWTQLEIGAQPGRGLSNDFSGDGGLIAMGPDGRPAFAINDLGMYRGRMTADGAPQTAIFADEKWAD